MDAIPYIDVRVFNYISDFVNGILTREQFWVLAKFKHPTHQINFCTERALRHINSENIDKISDELIENYNIKNGNFDNVKACKYNVPTYWDIGKVYKRLIIELCENEKKDPIDALVEVYNSWISDKIDNYNSSMYYENPSYIYYSYLEGQPILK